MRVIDEKMLSLASSYSNLVDDNWMGGTVSERLDKLSGVVLEQILLHDGIQTAVQSVEGRVGGAEKGALSNSLEPSDSSSDSSPESESSTVMGSCTSIMNVPTGL